MERGETSGESAPANHDVFLSFRGPDTRQGFIDCLYHLMIDAGIGVFKDDEDFPAGEKIEKILGKIRDSKICIPVFSKNYASSKWCLRELAEMISLNKKTIPIFYDVTPDDVNLKTSLYVEALEALCGGKRQKFDDGDDSKSKLREEKEEWEMALKRVCKYSGRERKGMGYGEFSKSIISLILPYLKIKEKIVTEHLIEIRDHIESMSKHLDVEAQDVIYVGVHGMVGIGKTTLAKVFFNKLSSQFEYCSFLANVRESSQKKGIEHLQKQLLCDLTCKSRDIKDSDDGIKSIRDASKDKKVLIVLDDVNKKEQIDKLAGKSSWFAPGSRIIITSRDKRVLDFKVCTLGHPKRVRTLEMRLMNQEEALQLFSLQAFNKVSSPTEYTELAKKAVSVSGYLPLSLEFVGSSLGRHKIDDWEQKIKGLQRIRHMGLQEKLMQIYKELHPRTQMMFLDIACFLINRETTNAIYMWEACGFHPDTGVEDLVSLSMVKIADDTFWTNDDLIKFGREIVTNENIMYAGKRSRLWKYEEALKMLKRGEGTETVEAICASDVEVSRLILPPSETIEFTHDSSKNLRNLRLLRFLQKKRMIMLNLRGDFEGLLPNLVWLSWHNCPIDLKATNLNLENLVVLDLSYSRITEEWDGWSKIKIGNSLKVLDLSHCLDLKQTPDLSMYQSLERLNLEGCWSLAKIDSSIGIVKTLKHLNVKGCMPLRGLPEEMCSLENLEELLIEGHNSPFTLPREIGNLKSLVKLELVGVKVTELPESLSQLKKLQSLSLRGCFGITQLPDSFRGLESLTELDISDTEIREWPESVGSLVRRV